MNYDQLTREQRYQIKALLKTGHSKAEIAEVIDVHRSTIHREIKCNSGKRGYRPKQADEKAVARRKSKGKPCIKRQDLQAIEILYTGEVEMAAQSHNLDVILTMKDGSYIQTVEPNLDAIFQVIQECGQPCADIMLATE